MEHESPGHSHTQKRSTATILIVDDEPLNIEVTSVFLEAAGYDRIVSTSDSRRAVDLLIESRPDIVLLDLDMPEVSGFEILEQIRSQKAWEHLPVLILTASERRDAKLESLRLGATDFLAKPVDESELVLRLRNTLAAKAYQDRLAHYDSLTGLLNRRMLTERLDATLRARRDQRTMATLLQINLDRFRNINDTLGPSCGDEVLQTVARRLVDCVRATDCIARPVGGEPREYVARPGGDEFTILISEIRDPEDAARVAQRILQGLSEPIPVADREVFVTPSIGIATSPADGEDAELLLKHADVAMSEAKKRGGNTFHFYSAEMNSSALGRLTLESELRRALSRDQLALWYQPKVDVASGAITGAEALLRWQHPELGMVGPDQFIPVAEEIGIMPALGEWVLQEACRQHAFWRDGGLGEIRIAVNVSGRQFQAADLPQIVATALHANGLRSSALVLELTESILMGNVGESLETLQRLRALDLELSVDDFGTGYSSLSYLKRFPLNELKIDRSFMRHADTDDDDRAIVAAIVGLARTLGLKVVAEGVENAAQLEILQELGCEQCQGYFFSKPLPAGEFAEFLMAYEVGPRNSA